MIKSKPLLTHNNQLMKALKFSDKDLDANRDGLLTRAQKIRIRNWQLGWTIKILLFALLVILMLILSVSTQTKMSIVMVLNTQLSTFMIIIPFVVVGLFVFQYWTFRVLKRGKVAAVQGPAKLDYQAFGKGSGHYIVMPRKRFRVEEEVYEAFVENEIYTLYYVPDFNDLLSAEHHGDEPRVGG